MMTGKFSMSRKQVLLASISLMCLLLLAFMYAENTDWDESWFRTPTRYNISSLLEGGTDDYVTPDKRGKTAKNADAAEGDGSAKVSKTAKVAKGDKEEEDYTDEAYTGAVPEGDGIPKASKTAKVAKDDEEEDKGDVSKTAKVTKGDNEEDDYLGEAKTNAGPEGDGSPMASKTAKAAKDDEEEDIYLDRTMGNVVDGQML